MKNKLVIEDLVFNDDEILTAPSMYVSNAAATEELDADTFSFPITGKFINGPQNIYDVDGNVIYTIDAEEVIVPDPAMDDYAVGLEAEYYHGDNLNQRMYITQVTREAEDIYTLKGQSLMGVLSEIPFYGDLYENVPITELLDEIFEGFNYTVALDVAEEKISGLIKTTNKRDALREILFCKGAAVCKDDNGEIYIRYPKATEIIDVDRDYLFDTGDSGYQIETPATKVAVTEHTYHAFDSDPTETLFDNVNDGSFAEGLPVLFDEPYHDLMWNNEPISESWQHSATHAIVSGVGILTGKRYTHTKHIIELDTGAEAAEKVKEFTDNYLVNGANSYNVAARLANLYSMAKTMQIGLFMDGPTVKTTDQISFIGPFNKKVTGYVESMDVTVNNINTAVLTIRPDYVPDNFGSNFRNSELFTADGTWTVPDGVTRIRIVLGGGGQGGEGGQAGQKAPNQWVHIYWVDLYDSRAELIVDVPDHFCEGGEAGKAGLSGKVYVADIDVTPGTVLSFRVGVGGQPGIGGTQPFAKGTEGTDGTATTLTLNGVQYTSENGASPANGYIDAVTGDVYSTPGEAGLNGGAGGYVSSQKVLIGSSNPGQDGEDAGSWKGGKGDTTQLYYSSQFSAWGSSAGGAAFGQDGGNGIAPTNSLQMVDGGKGADAQINTKIVPLGGGGNAGSGGGGAGQGGYGRYTANDGDQDYYGYGTGMSTPGKGADGVPGGNGYVLINY